jgi:hypothetical protein
MERLKTECAYCGATKNLTRDHIPPKAIFPEPRPGDLITVLACRTCNASFQQDDEYFTTSLALRAGIERTPQGRRLVDVVRRSWGRPEAQRFQNFVASTLRVAGDNADRFGVRPETVGQWIDASRLGRTTSRIVRGLLYHDTGKRLPPEYHTVSILLEQADDVTKSALLKPLLGRAPVETGNGAFAYVWNTTVDDFSSAWLLVFYAEAATFLVATGKRQPNNT